MKNIVDDYRAKKIKKLLMIGLAHCYLPQLVLGMAETIVREKLERLL